MAPELLGEVGYRQWTAQGRLGHPTWRGLRHGTHPAAVQGPVVLGAAADVPRVDERELAELDEALRRARGEVDALRAQLCPHFLYNALTTIAALVRTDPHRARELLVEFAGFTRYCFRSATDTTLGDELDNVERYLTLEQARLDERLQVRLQVAPAVLPVALPSFAVQLVVENAVRRGGTVRGPTRRGGTMQRGQQRAVWPGAPARSSTRYPRRLPKRRTGWLRSCWARWVTGSGPRRVASVTPPGAGYATARIPRRSRGRWCSVLPWMSPGSTSGSSPSWTKRSDGPAAKWTRCGPSSAPTSSTTP